MATSSIVSISADFLPVPHLPHIEVGMSAEFNLRPPQQDVRGRLHHPLTFDDALTVVSGAGTARDGLEHRRFQPV